MESDNQIHLLELYGQKTIQPAKKAYEEIYSSLMSLKKRYDELNENEQEMAHRLDLLEFQRQELEEAALQPNEDEHLEQERQQLANNEGCLNSLKEAYNSINRE